MKSSTALLLTNVLNPFLIFTLLYAAVAFVESPVLQALLYTLIELLAAGAVAGFVNFLRRRRRVGDFWISGRTERRLPALFAIFVLVILLGALELLDAPATLSLTTLSVGLATVSAAVVTLFWKISAHSTVAGYAAAAAPLLLGTAGWAFAFLLPPVLWARVALGAHTMLQALGGTLLGIAFALALLT
jgi:membrane-associated phospholipid phosphatase